MKKLTEPRNNFGFTIVWTQDGKLTGSNIFLFFFFFFDQLCTGEATGDCSQKIIDPSYFYL